MIHDGILDMILDVDIHRLVLKGTKLNDPKRNYLLGPVDNGVNFEGVNTIFCHRHTKKKGEGKERKLAHFRIKE